MIKKFGFIIVFVLFIAAAFPAVQCMAAAAQPLTQDEVQRLNVMEQEWAATIDKAVLFIRQKNASLAGVQLKKAAGTLAGMKDLLIKKNFDVSSVDRLVAMDRLTEAYANMSQLTAFIAAPRSIAGNAEKIWAIFADTRKKLLEAQMKFHQVPALQELCKNFRGSLDEFENEVKRVIAER